MKDVPGYRLEGPGAGWDSRGSPVFSGADQVHRSVRPDCCPPDLLGFGFLFFFSGWESTFILVLSQAGAQNRLWSS